MRTALKAELGPLQCDAWQEDFCSSAFLLDIGKKKKVNLLGCVCRNILEDPRSGRKEGEIEEMWNEGGLLACHVQVFILGKSFLAAAASDSGSC